MRLYRLALPYLLVPLIALGLISCSSRADRVDDGKQAQSKLEAQGTDLPVLSLVAPRSSPENDAALLELVSTLDTLNPSLQISASLLSAYDSAVTDLVHSSSPPDVFLTPAYQLQSYVDEGLLLPIPDELIDRTSLLQPALDAVTIDGVAYCLPQSLHTLALLYNEELLQEVGLIPEDIDWTWQSLNSALSATSALTDAVGIMLDANFATIAPFYYQATERTPTAHDTGPVDIEAAQAATEYVATLFANGYAATPSALEASWTGEAFANGDAVMTIAGDWIIPYLAAGAPLLDYGVTELPTGPAGNATVAYVNCLAVRVDSANKDLAVQLASQLTEPEVLKDWTWADGSSLSPYFVEDVEPNADDLRYRPFLRSLRYAVPWTMQNYAQRTAARFEEAIQLVVDEELDPGDVWEYASR